MKRAIVFLFLINMLFSCDDFLSRSPLVSLSPDNFFNNEEECKLLVTSLYNPISYQDYTFLDEYTDDVYSAAQVGGSGQKFIQGDIQAFDSYSKNRWSKNYKAIGNANLAVNGISVSSISEGTRNRLVAEAKFFRAYYYYDLIALFGDVPLVLTDPSVSENLCPARDTREKVFQQVIEDLNYAIQYLPVSYTGNDIGRVTKGAALAFKARVLLFFSEYEEAAKAAEACMELGVYKLFPDFRGLFLEENEYNEEVIFDKGYLKDIMGSGRNTNIITQDMYLPTLSLANEFEMNTGKMVTEDGSNFDSQNLFKDRDSRLSSTILLPGAIKDGLLNSDGSPVVFIPANDLSVTGMRLKKSADYTDNTNNNSGTNFIIIRYADVLLMYAEALNEIEGPTSSVYNAINQVRQRAHQPVLTNGLTKEAMREKIRHERRVEFAGEGLRYFDIVRWKIADVVFSNNLEGYDKQNLKNPSNPAEWKFTSTNVLKTSWNASKGYLWPIPGEERLLNSNLTQNEGY